METKDLKFKNGNYEISFKKEAIYSLEVKAKTMEGEYTYTIPKNLEQEIIDTVNKIYD